MKSSTLQLQDLIGRKVVDANGQPAGRIEEIVARKHGCDYLVEEFHLGSRAMIERLSVSDVSMFFLRFFGAYRHPATNLAKWEQIDVTDPMHPKLKCAKEELEQIKRPSRR